MSRNRRSNFVPKFEGPIVGFPKTIIPTQKSIRLNDGKLKWSLIDYPSMEPLIKVMMQGAEKYGIGNWQIGLDLVEIQESAQRHLAAMMNGELTDLESKEFHAGHVMANMMMWMYHYNKQKENV